jgi:dihydrofolate synthase/folylpolyglutamate synthase
MSSYSPDTTASLADWLAYLETLHKTPIDLGLERIRQVSQRLGVTFPFIKITVGGTNGKGSTCAMLEAILVASGYKVGTYTSPHLVHYNERIRLDGAMATDQQIIEQFARIDQARGEITLSYFEFSTLAALLLFEQQRVDVAVLEVGMGGRLDAVNMIDTDCAVITSIDIDHAQYLGDTREKIGFEKAGIFRPGKPAICADPLCPQSVIDHARSIGADLWLFGEDFNYSGDRQQWAYGGRSQRRAGLAYPSLRGANQLLNASAVLAALESLRLDLVVPQQAVRIGFSQVSLPGRFQVLPGTPVVILDVAHNPHAAGALAHNLDNMGQQFPVTHAVVGMLGDKDIPGVLARLVDRIDHWHCATLQGPRAIRGEQLAAYVRDAIAARGATPAQSGPGMYETVSLAGGSEPGKPGVRPAVVPRLVHEPQVSIYDSASEAFAGAQELASVNDRILVFGSFSSVGPVLQQLGQRTD